MEIDHRPLSFDSIAGALCLLLSFGGPALANPTKASGFDLEAAKARCVQTSSQVLYRHNFRWGFSPEDMSLKFHEIYASGKRLLKHATYDPKRDVFHMEQSVAGGEKEVVLTPHFIKNLTRHAEEALKKGFADYIFFPDMGHSHLYFRDEHWDKEYRAYVDRLAVKDLNQLYEKMLNDPEMYALYHTAEQLELVRNDSVIDDPYIIFRWNNRNPMIPNTLERDLTMPVNLSHTYNTVSEVKGYTSWSAGFNMSASQQGCFPYKTPDGKTLYFDVSLWDLPVDPARSEPDMFRHLDPRWQHHIPYDLSWKLHRH